MTGNKVKSAEEQEYECVAVLNDLAIVFKDLYMASHGYSQNLDDITDFLGNYAGAMAAKIFSDVE